MDYNTLSTADLLLLARDALRGKESDHFRLSLVHEPGSQARMETLTEEIEDIKAKVAELESAVDEDSS